MFNISVSVMRSLLNLFDCVPSLLVPESVHSQQRGWKCPFSFDYSLRPLNLWISPTVGQQRNLLSLILEYSFWSLSLGSLLRLVQEALQIRVSIRVPCAPHDCSVWTTWACLLSAHHCNFPNLLLPLPWHCSLYAPSQNNVHAKPF